MDKFSSNIQVAFSIARYRQHNRHTPGPHAEGLRMLNGSLLPYSPEESASRLP
jgi:hypothetical protein